MNFDFLDFSNEFLLAVLLIFIITALVSLCAIFFRIINNRFKSSDEDDLQEIDSKDLPLSEQRMD